MPFFIFYTINIIIGKLSKGVPDVHPYGFSFEQEFQTRWNDSVLLCSACTVKNQIFDRKQGAPISVLPFLNEIPVKPRATSSDDT